MEKEKEIDRIFNILVQFENISDPTTAVTELSYKHYLNQLWIWYIGCGDEYIANYLKGLENLGAEAEHDEVRRIVLNLTNRIDRESKEADYNAQ